MKKMKARSFDVGSSLAVAVAAAASMRPLRSLTALQAGAHDGKAGDPIFDIVQKYFGKIVLVEPQPNLIGRLKKSYSSFNGEAIIENVAIGQDPSVILHIPTPELDALYIAAMKRSASPLVSSDRNYIVEIIASRTGLSREKVEDGVEATKVVGKTIEDLVNKHLDGTVDLLQIDCEGYDWKVLKTVGHIRPAIINFESDKLSEDDVKEWEDWAARNGYVSVTGRMDTMAFRPPG